MVFIIIISDMFPTLLRINENILQLLSDTNLSLNETQPKNKDGR